MNVITNNKWIGQRTIRPDGADKVTGRRPLRDTAMPGMIWGKVLRSPHPHARINRSTPRRRGAAWREGGGHVARYCGLPDRQVGDARHPDMRWMWPQRDGAREGAVSPGHRSRPSRHVRGDRGKGLRMIEVDYDVLPWSSRSGRASARSPILHDFMKFEGKPHTSRQDRGQEG